MRHVFRRRRSLLNQKRTKEPSMTRKKIASLVFQSLHSPPRQEAVARFTALRPSDLKKILLHLDQTGLAVYLLNHLAEHNLYAVLAPQLQNALKERLAKNEVR